MKFEADWVGWDKNFNWYIGSYFWVSKYCDNAMRDLQAGGYAYRNTANKLKQDLMLFHIYDENYSQTLIEPD